MSCGASPWKIYRSQQRFQAEIDEGAAAFVCCILSVRCAFRARVIHRSRSGGHTDRSRARSRWRGASFSQRLSSSRHAHRADSGCANAFVCPYHGWTYELDGRLRHVPHAEGFPGTRQTRSWSRAAACCREPWDGLRFASADWSASPLAGLPELIGKDQRLYASSARVTEANWKIVLEGFLEGYHIRVTHPETFFPYGFDNLNVIEHVVPHSRVTYPFRRIEKLAAVPPAERRVMGFVTFVYHIFRMR
jgi:hypothetical protein